jgi:murein DD-endopeptidase MepM/ murein hydrolase activator NlpD
MSHRKRCTKAVPRYLGSTLLSVAISLATFAPPAYANAVSTLSTTADATPLVTSSKRVKLDANETLDALLAREGVHPDQRAAAINALSDLVDIRKLQAGDDIEVSMRARDGEDATLAAIHIHGAKVPDLTIVANERGEFLRPTEYARTWSTSVMTRTGTVTRDFENDLLRADVPTAVARDVIAAFAYDSSLPRNLAKGTRFNVVYEGATTGNPQTDANMLRFAEVTIKGKPHRVYRYQMPDGKVSYMDEDGQGVMPLRLDKPITDSARMTSGFGWRTHPVLKVRKFHNGVDWAAPKGTPVYASEDGTIEQIAWRGNYGRYIRISHSSRVATAYAHLAKFADGLHKGSAVRKGQIIAYVGASGLATGNHLYYEVLVDNKFVDPLNPNLTMTVNLDQKALEKFHQFAASSTQPLTLAPLNP